MTRGMFRNEWMWIWPCPRWGPTSENDWLQPQKMQGTHIHLIVNVEVRVEERSPYGQSDRDGTWGAWGGRGRTVEIVTWDHISIPYPPVVDGSRIPRSLSTVTWCGIKFIIFFSCTSSSKRALFVTRQNRYH